ncbi:hypothetical protein XENOCAPTIV_014841 [Xenoophorus captivus]|uniref:Uncharacterized protein n=1 Tax=Xenoophorus captivus TaxID=1517983 RepID=A0ABV0RU32_9TELE
MSRKRALNSHLDHRELVSASGSVSGPFIPETQKSDLMGTRCLIVTLLLRQKVAEVQKLLQTHLRSVPQPEPTVPEQCGPQPLVSVPCDPELSDPEPCDPEPSDLVI